MFTKFWRVNVLEVGLLAGRKGNWR